MFQKKLIKKPGGPGLRSKDKLNFCFFAAIPSGSNLAAADNNLAALSIFD